MLLNSNVTLLKKVIVITVIVLFYTYYQKLPKVSKREYFEKTEFYPN